MTGRPPKPLQVRQNEGDAAKIGKRKLAAKLAAEPKAQPGLPECPPRLRGIARETWFAVTEDLEIMQLHQRPGAYEREMFCLARAKALQAEEQLEREGITLNIPIYDREGMEIGVNKKQHPAQKTATEAWKKVQEFASAYGLNPVSRTRLAVEKAEDPTEE